MANVSMAESFIEAMADLSAADAKRCAAFLDRLMRVDEFGSLRPEIIHSASDRSIRSLRVTHDLRAIIHMDGDDWLLLYVDRHDGAYLWARGHCVRCHPRTGELQVVADPHRADATMATWEQPPVPGVFDGCSDEYLLSLGVPPEWLATLRQVKSDEMFLAIADDLPDEVAERLLRVAAGEVVGPPPSVEMSHDWRSAERSWICTVHDGHSLCRLLDERGIPHEELGV